MLAIKKEQLAVLENQNEVGNIDLFYGDETGISELVYVPYGWQEKGENLALNNVGKNYKINFTKYC